MAKMTKGAFSTMLDGKMASVSGYLFEMLLGDGTVKKMGTYEDKERKCWYVIDLATGLSLCSSTTRKDAVARAMSEPMVQRFTELVNSGKYEKAKALGIAGKIEQATGEKVEVKVESFTTGKKPPKAPAKPEGWKEAPKSPEPEIATEIASLEGERVCITGTLTGMTRGEAFTRLKMHGATPSERFTSKVTMVAVGENAGASKRAKYEKAIANGQQVKVVSGTALVAALLKPAEHRVEEPKKEEPMDKKIEELEAKLRAAEAAAKMWKDKAEEYYAAKDAAPAAPEPVTEPEPEPEQAVAVSLEFMRAWCGERSDVIATQKREGCCIWVEGSTKPYADELAELGFRWSRGRKAWYMSA